MTCLWSVFQRTLTFVVKINSVFFMKKIQQDINNCLALESHSYYSDGFSEPIFISHLESLYKVILLKLT